MSARELPTGVYRRKGGTICWIYYSHHGKQHHESSESENPKVAERLRRKRLGEIDAGTFAPAAKTVTVADLLELVVQDYRARGRRSMLRLENAIEHVTEEMGTELAANMTTKRLKDAVATWQTTKRERTDKPLSASSISIALSALKRGYRLAREDGMLATAPIFPTITVNNAREGFFEQPDFERVRGALRSETAKNVVTFAYLTGWRTRSEILTLTWEQVHFDTGKVELYGHQTKNGKPRVFPFHVLPELHHVLGLQKLAAEMFEEIHGWRPEYVFFHRDGERGGEKPGAPLWGFARQWRAACKRIGLEGRILHDFRRTAVRNLIRAGIPEVFAMKLSGHLTRKIFDRYSIVSDRDLEESVTKLANLHQREQETQSKT